MSDLIDQSVCTGDTHIHTHNPSISISANLLPRPRSDTTSVPYKDTFILVGGWEEAEVCQGSFCTIVPHYYDTMLIYEPETDGWTELDDKIRPYGLDNIIAMVVKRSMLPECT